MKIWDIVYLNNVPSTLRYSFYVLMHLSKYIRENLNIPLLLGAGQDYLTKKKNTQR